MARSAFCLLMESLARSDTGLMIQNGALNMTH